ncbi:unnamed protein product [Linum tenue]|uniref:Uncharacterized protein n=1 Tax=Linum tenue TaxID=586396 RepID=A0AAV0M1E9_9ROSI|nr:unnamed protein product [Linum tenue]
MSRPQLTSCRGQWSGRVGKEVEIAPRYKRASLVTSLTPSRTVPLLPSTATTRCSSERVLPVTSILLPWSLILIQVSPNPHSKIEFNF